MTIKEYTIVSIVINLLLISKSEGREAGRYKRIVGGDIVLKNEIKYQASVRYDGLYICAGTIISSKHILTAAHCFAGLDLDFSAVTIVTGATKLSDRHNEHSVFNITWHEDFVFGADHNNYNRNDIAVITLDDEIIFNDSQEAALLPNSPTPEEATGVVIGWGWEDQNNGYPSKVLKKIQVEVISRQKCQEKMQYNLHQGQFCGIAGPASGFCKGDSGGSLVADRRVIGFASWNDGCASGRPDVYTDVYEHLNFINKAMNIKSCLRYRAPGC